MQGAANPRKPPPRGDKGGQRQRGDNGNYYKFKAEEVREAYLSDRESGVVSCRGAQGRQARWQQATSKRRLCSSVQYQSCMHGRELHRLAARCVTRMRRKHHRYGCTAYHLVCVCVGVGGGGGAGWLEGVGWVVVVVVVVTDTCVYL